jgi:hypothetical protein
VEGRVRESGATGGLVPTAGRSTPAARSGARHPRPALPNPYVAPRNEDEAALVQLWQELFGIEPVGVEDDFFALGGNSLLATQLASRIRDTLASDMPLRALFEQSTIGGLASAITSRRQRSAAPHLAPGPLSSAGTAQELLGRLETLSDTEVDSLLVDMLHKRAPE